MKRLILSCFRPRPVKHDDNIGEVSAAQQKTPSPDDADRPSRSSGRGAGARKLDPTGAQLHLQRPSSARDEPGAPRSATEEAPLSGVRTASGYTVPARAAALQPAHTASVKTPVETPEALSAAKHAAMTLKLRRAMVRRHSAAGPAVGARSTAPQHGSSPQFSGMLATGNSISAPDHAAQQPPTATVDGSAASATVGAGPTTRWELLRTAVSVTGRSTTTAPFSAPSSNLRLPPGLLAGALRTPSSLPYTPVPYRHRRSVDASRDSTSFTTLAPASFEMTTGAALSRPRSRRMHDCPSAPRQASTSDKGTGRDAGTASDR
ncbi:hypothetical protein TSOC_014783, partial [Tetrabaena socialis]